MKIRCVSSLLKPLAFLFLVLFVSCQSTGSFHFGSYSEGERLYEKREYGKAIAKYEEYIRDHPEGNMAVISQYYMARSYEELGQAEKAREIYEKIVKEKPQLIWASFSKTRLEEIKKQAV